MALLIIYAILAVIFAVIGAEMAKSRNRDAAAWALICALVPLIGIIALAVAGKAQAAPDYSPPLRQLPSQPKPANAIRVANAKAYDEKRWRALLDVDDDLSEAAKQIEAHGRAYVDEFAEKYLALGENIYLEALKSKILCRAEQDKIDREAKIQQEKLDMEDQSGRFYQDYIAKLDASGGIDPDYHTKVVKVEKYVGNAPAFRDGVKVHFEDGTFALKGGFVIRRFSDERELEEWG